MHIEDGRIRFTPSDLAVFFASEFASWMDRWALELRRGRVHALPVPIAGAAPAGNATPAAFRDPELAIFAVRRRARRGASRASRMRRRDAQP
jgi:hypothetical protein